MSPQNQQDALARADGFVFLRPCEAGDIFKRTFTNTSTNGLTADMPVRSIGMIPDYLTDLNAMHRLIRVLNGRSKGIYLENLMKVVANSKGNKADLSSDALLDFHETKIEFKCEAYLKTIDKWEQK